MSGNGNRNSMLLKLEWLSILFCVVIGELSIKRIDSLLLGRRAGYGRGKPHTKPFHVHCPRRGGSGAGWSGDACVALGARTPRRMQASHPPTQGDASVPTTHRHHSRPYADDTSSQTTSRKTYL